MSVESKITQIITENFPDIHSEILNYVEGVLKDAGDDFHNPDDVYDAVGGVLEEVAGADGEASNDAMDILDICQQLLNTLKMFDGGGCAASADEASTINGVTGGRRTLDTPIHLRGAIDEQDAGAGNRGELAGTDSIWLIKRDDTTRVDQRKLEKAEAKIKQKQERRTVGGSAAPSSQEQQYATPSTNQATNRKEAKMESAGTNRSFDVKIENFDIAFGEKVLLCGADLSLTYGRRYGLVGRNGIGKTTLLRMISSGELRIPGHISILHVEQEVVGDEHTTALDSVLQCDTRREALLREERELLAQTTSSTPSSTSATSTQTGSSSRLQEVYSELEQMEADKAPARASVILCGLGFTSDMQQMVTREFSGGWRMRLALARALFTLPDLLLLDEPTNMLDMKAIIWLENYLQSWQSSILVVSHDRNFLDSVTTDIVHMHTRRLDSYRGNYDNFVKAKVEKLKNQQKEYEAQQQYRAHLQAYIDRWRYNANRAPQAQMRIKILEKLPDLQPVEKESEVVLKIPDPDPLSPPILQLDDVGFSYQGGRPVFTKICVGAGMDSRICIVGDNGAGKSTLLKLLLGELTETSGVRHAHRSLRVGYFSQHHVDQLDMNVSSLKLMANKFPGCSDETYRGHLGRYGVTGDLALRSVQSLSGGQKSRVAFAIMTYTRPHIYILDEPTNHLDMETIEALGVALNKFKGGVVLVSHDERLIRVVCKELWWCHDGTVTTIEGGFDEYKILVEKELTTISR